MVYYLNSRWSRNTTHSKLLSKEVKKGLLISLIPVTKHYQGTTFQVAGVEPPNIREVWHRRNTDDGKTLLVKSSWNHQLIECQHSHHHQLSLNETLDFRASLWIARLETMRQKRITYCEGFSSDHYFFWICTDTRQKTASEPREAPTKPHT